MQWREYLFRQTHRAPFLWKMVFGILLAGWVLGLVASWSIPRSQADYVQRAAFAQARGSAADTLDMLEKMLAAHDLNVEQLLDVLVVLDSEPPQPQRDELLGRTAAERIDPATVQQRLADSSLAADTKLIALGLWKSLAGDKLTAELLEMAERSPPIRFANQAVGEFWLSQEAFSEAAAAFEREGKFAEAKEARKQAILIYAHREDIDALKRLAADPTYGGELPTYVRTVIAESERDWWTYWWLVPRVELERLPPGPAALALFTGCCWFVFSLQAGQVGSARGARWWLCGAAVVLGMLSIWPTDFLISWQEKTWGLTPSQELGPGIKFFVLGVGLREELSKLLLFLPLAPLVARRGNELEALIVAACVGLGFATYENTQYFASSLGSASVGRFLTANFFHMAATGLAGLALVRGIWQPRTHGPEALAVFGVIVLAHGLYDACIGVRVLAEYVYGSSIIYVLLAYQFFHELRRMRIERRETISLTATFLAGVSLVTAVTFIYLSGRVGATLAAELLVPQLLSTALMVYMFLREMPRSLVST